jgi:hypothetical protein
MPRTLPLLIREHADLACEFPASSLGQDSIAHPQYCDWATLSPFRQNTTATFVHRGRTERPLVGERPHLFRAKWADKRAWKAGDVSTFRGRGCARRATFQRFAAMWLRPLAFGLRFPRLLSDGRLRRGSADLPDRLDTVDQGLTKDQPGPTAEPANRCFGL